MPSCQTGKNFMPWPFISKSLLADWRREAMQGSSYKAYNIWVADLVAVEAPVRQVDVAKTAAALLEDVTN